MSTLLTDSNTVNVATDSDVADINATTIPGATVDEQKAIDDYRATEARVVELAIATLDPKDMLVKYAKLGHEALKLAAKRKASLKPGAWDKSDFAKVCDDLTTLIKMRVAIRDVEMDKYVRIHLWVEAVKPLCPNVDKLSFFQVKNKFLPTLTFDAVALTGDLNEQWLGWVQDTVERQLSNKPLSMKELDALVAEKRKEIEHARHKNETTEQALEREQKAKEASFRAERNSAQSKIADAVDKALSAEHAAPKDVAEIVAKVVKDHNLTMPAAPGVFDAASCTENDIRAIANGLFQAGKLAEIKLLHKILSQMIQIADSGLSLSKKAG
jgi:hypothetical protein